MPPIRSDGPPKRAAQTHHHHVQVESQCIPEPRRYLHRRTEVEVSRDAAALVRSTGTHAPSCCRPMAWRRAFCSPQCRERFAAIVLAARISRRCARVRVMR